MVRIPQEHGRPFWRIPRRFVIASPWNASTWAELDSAAQTLLPALEIFGNGVDSHAGYRKLCRCCGAPGTVSKGFKALAGAAIVERHPQRNIWNGYKRFRNHFSSLLLVHPNDRFARVDQSVVTGGAWKAMNPVTRSIYIPLLCGVQHEKLKRWMLNATTGQIVGPCRKIVQTPHEWRDARGRFVWLRFMAAMKADSTMRRNWAPHLPFVSLMRHDAGAIGVGELAILSGRSKPAIREAIPQLEELNLALCLSPPQGSNEARRFVLPPVVDWKHDPHFLDVLPPKRPWHEAPTKPGSGETPF